mgnify:FL=1
MRLTLRRNHGEGPPEFDTYLQSIPFMSTERYNPREAEPRWQKAWDAAKLFETKNDDPREKY